MSDNYLLYDPAVFGALEIKEDTRDAEIDRLRAENEKLRAALKPFLIEHWPEHKVYGYKMVFVTPDDLRAAAAALKEMGDE